MTTIQNSNLNYTGLIQKYIGTAYDKVSFVSDHLEEIIALYELYKSGELDDLIDLAPELENIIDWIKQFFDTYYGAYPNHPEYSPNCTAPEPGDMYYNTTDNLLYIFNGIWVPIGHKDQHIEVITVEADMIVSGTAIIHTERSYIPKSNNLLIFTNTGDGNKFEYSTFVDPDGKYDEIDANTIHFPNSYLSVGDEVIAVIGVESSTLVHTVSIIQKIYNTQRLSEQTIVIPDEVHYVVGSGNLEIYVDRVLQIVELDYLEVNSNTIRFLTPLPDVGTEVIFNVGAVISNAPTITTLMQDTKPDESLYGAGTLWLNTATGRTFILYKDTDTTQWISISSEEGIIIPIDPPPTGGYVMDTVFSCDAPDVNVYGQGSRWFNSCTGEEFILYVDTDSRQWLKIYK